MTSLISVLAVLLTCILPGRVFPGSHPLSGSVRPNFCVTRFPDDEGPSFYHPRCLGGTAMTVSWGSMKVKPAHGKALVMHFTDETEFATESGEGALDGPVPGDYVCVTYLQRRKAATALLVVFDVKSLPCRAAGPKQYYGVSQPDG